MVYHVPSVVSQLSPPINIFLFVVKCHTLDEVVLDRICMYVKWFDLEIEVHRISYCFFVRPTTKYEV